MNVRSQVSMVFHLDKCIGCHTCSLACKNLWTSRPGAEYMWWNNVETKPGTGYPTLYEDQEQRSEEHTSELQSLRHLVCRLLHEKKKSRRVNSIHLGISDAFLCLNRN